MRFFSGVVLLAALSGCPKPKCDAATCVSGCCDTAGTCQTGDSASACGTGGALCATCLGGSCSALKVCASGGTGGGSGGSSGGGSGGSGGGGSTGSRTVTFTRTVTLRDERGTQTVSSLGDAGLTLTTPDGTVLPGTRTDSSFIVPNVPVGEYFLREGNFFYVGHADTLEVGFNDLGRPNPEWVDAGAATFTLATAGLPAWGDLDAILLFSQGANLYGFDMTALTAGPTAGVVPSAFTWDYGRLEGGTRAGRLDGTKGDTLWAVWLQNQALITTPVAGAADDGGTADVAFACGVSAAVAHVPSLTINAGPNAAAATFTATPSQSIGVTFPRTQWATRVPEGHPLAEQYYEEVYVSAEPAPDTASVDLLYCTNDPRYENPVSDINRSLSVVNPFPASWQVVSTAAIDYRVGKSIADAGTWYATGSASVKLDLNQPLAPQVHPPAQVRVQSIPADQLVTVAAAGPLSVTWQPNAASPAPTEYAVFVLHLTRSNGVTSRTQVAGALTRGTSFTFPAGTLAIGGIYQLRVRARVTTAPEARPYSSRISSTADAITNPFLAQ
jgi:hypothetical protein